VRNISNVKNIEIESRKLPKISGFIATKVSPKDADLQTKISMARLLQEWTHLWMMTKMGFMLVMCW